MAPLIPCFTSLFSLVHVTFFKEITQLVVAHGELLEMFHACVKESKCLVYQKAFAKEQMCISLRTVAWEPRIPFSELPLKSLMLLHLLLREFVDCVAELHGQQGVAVGVGCVRVKREVSFVFVEKQ